jgi:hypothetical protein
MKQNYAHKEREKEREREREKEVERERERREEREIYNCYQLTRVFASRKPFQPSVMSASKAGACPSEAPFKGITLV